MGGARIRSAYLGSANTHVELEKIWGQIAKKHVTEWPGTPYLQLQHTLSSAKCFEMLWCVRKEPFGE